MIKYGFFLGILPFIPKPDNLLLIVLELTEIPIAFISHLIAFDEMYEAYPFYLSIVNSTCAFFRPDVALFFTDFVFP